MNLRASDKNVILMYCRQPKSNRNLFLAQALEGSRELEAISFICSWSCAYGPITPILGDAEILEEAFFSYFPPSERFSLTFLFSLFTFPFFLLSPLLSPSSTLRCWKNRGDGYNMKKKGVQQI